MENRELDQLFKNALDTTANYTRPEQQWKQVQARLAEQPSRRFGAWWWLGGSSLLVLLLFSWWQLSGTSSQTRATSAVTTTFALPTLVQTTSAKGPEATIDNAERTAQIEVVVPAVSTTPLSTKRGVADSGLSLASLSFSSAILPKREGVNDAITASVGDDFTYRYSANKATTTTTRFTGQELRKLPTLPFQEVISEQVNQEELLIPSLAETPTIVKANNGTSILLTAGWQRSFISSTRVQQLANEWQKYAGITVRFAPRWRASVRYTAGATERQITGDPTDYRIPLIDPPSEDAVPTITELSYREQRLEAGVAFQVVKRRYFSLAIMSGVQWRNQTKIATVYNYDGIYLPLTVNGELPDSRLRLAALSGGLTLTLPLTKYFSLHSRYQRYFSVGQRHFQWPGEAILQLGMGYRLK